MWKRILVWGSAALLVGFFVYTTIISMKFRKTVHHGTGQFMRSFTCFETCLSKEEEKQAQKIINKCQEQECEEIRILLNENNCENIKNWLNKNTP